MTRRYHAPRPLTVRAEPGGAPTWVRWQGRSELVQVCNHWRSGGAWWRDEPPREFYRVLTRSRVLLVLARDGGDGRWYVVEVDD